MTKPVPIVLNMSEWDTSSIRYMQPKVNDRGAKSIVLISTQTNRALHISTPMMMTWGISDLVDEEGGTDGKFRMLFHYNNKGYVTVPRYPNFIEPMSVVPTKLVLSKYVQERLVRPEAPKPDADLDVTAIDTLPF